MNSSKPKILHLPESYLPGRIGGKEVYCHTLVKELNSCDLQNLVCIHRSSEDPEDFHSYEHEGVRVEVLPTLPIDNLRRIKFEKTFTQIPGFRDLLEREKPDVVHFHDQNGGASLSHLQEVKRLGIPAIITYHSPGQTCPQGELLRNGTIPCDGKLTGWRCTNCRLQYSGLPASLAPFVAAVEWPGVDATRNGAVSRVLSTRQMIRKFSEGLQEFISLTDAIVVLAEWCTEVWRLNGTPPEKIHLIPTGGRAAWQGDLPPRFQDRSPRVLRVACLGRCTEIKGFHVLVDAVKQLPFDAAIEVHFLSPSWDDEYGRGLLSQIAGDNRFHGPRHVLNAKLLEELIAMDLVVIPSLWLETGPLTLFDAFAARVPVVGSRLGGIEERIKHGENGFLFDPGNATQLSGILKSILSDARLLQSISSNVQPLPTMEAAAVQYVTLYDKLVSE